MDKRTHRWWVILVLVAAAALLLGPTCVASQEDAQEKVAAKPEDPAKAKKAGTPAEPASDEADEADDTEAAQEAATHPSFNTIEELVAFHGSVASLWTARTEAEPQIRWRVVEPGPRDPS